MPTRQVVGQIVKPDGASWAGFNVEFTLTPTAYALDEAYPETAVSTMTDVTGSFAATLVTGVQYVVSYPDIFGRTGSSTQYPRGSSFAVVVPEGIGAVTLGALQAAANIPVAPPSVLTLIDAAVDPLAASITTLEARQRGTYQYQGSGPPEDNAVLLANAITGDTYLDGATGFLYQLNGNPV